MKDKIKATAKAKVGKEAKTKGSPSSMRKEAARKALNAMRSTGRR